MLVIYVMQRGFVMVGEPHEDSREWIKLRLKRCGIIRRWGTTKGLGELAMKGPLHDTIIDKEPDDTCINKLCVYREIPCDEKAWEKWKP